MNDKWKSLKKEVFEFVKLLVFWFLVFLIVTKFLVSPIQVIGSSMHPTLKNKERGFSSVLSKNFDIERFDIVVVKDIDGDYIIKRVIGLPGDYIAYKEDVLYINGKAQEKRFTQDETKDFTLEEICEISQIECNGEIPSDMYLVLGDNRDVSADSRVKGLIKREQIQGKTIFRLWPLNKIGLLK